MLKNLSANDDSCGYSSRSVPSMTAKKSRSPYVVSNLVQAGARTCSVPVVSPLRNVVMSGRKVFCCYSSLKADIPRDPLCTKRRQNEAMAWQVRQPVRCMTIIDTVGPLGIPRSSEDLDCSTMHIHDIIVSSVVQCVRHAVTLHDHLRALAPCLVFPDEKSADVRIEQVWYPGTHYDLGYNSFRFIQRSFLALIGVCFGLIPSSVYKTVHPNEVLADNVLRWVLERIFEIEGDETSIIPRIHDHLAALNRRINSTPDDRRVGSGDVYRDPSERSTVKYVS